MAEFLYGSHSKRLIEYIVVVGCQPCKAARRKNFVQNPKILRRYPVNDHEDFPLPSDVVFFCQPDGCLCSFDEQGVDEGDGELTLTFSFTLTEKETNTKRHGVCLNFFRRCQVTVNAGVDEDDENDDDKSSVFSLTSLCLLSHHPFFVPFANCVATLRRLVEDIPAASSCFRGKSRACENEWDDFLSNDCASEKSLKVLELEGWINRLLKSPVPEAGRTRLELELAIQPAITLAYPDESKLFLVDFPVYLPLELLGVELTLKVLAAILLEQKVVLSAVDYQSVSTCVMAFLVYLYPLEYVYTVIPLLPTSMPLAEALMQSPAPFLIGVPASFFHCRRGVKQPNDVWLVDLDTQEMVEPQVKTSFPDLPEAEVNVLKTKLNKALESLDSLPTHSGSLKVSQGSYDDIDTGCDPMAIDIAIRVAFIQFMLSPGLLGALKPHLRCLRLFPKPVVAQQKHFFLRTLVKEQGKQGGPFVKQLIFTQSADCFGEWYYLTSPSSAVMRIMQDRATSPQSIGDKPKYYFERLISLPFSVFESSSPLGEAMLELKAKDIPRRSMSPSISSSSSSMSSVSSLYEARWDWYNFESATESMTSTIPYSISSYNPYSMSSSRTATLDGRQLLTMDSVDTDYEDDSLMRRMTLLQGCLGTTPEPVDGDEMDDNSSIMSSHASSMARRMTEVYTINPVFVKLTHVDMPSESTDSLSEGDKLSSQVDKMEIVEERNEKTQHAKKIVTNNDTQSHQSEASDDAVLDQDELFGQQVDRHHESDLNGSISSTQEDVTSLSTNPFDKRSESDPGPSSASPQEIPIIIKNTHRSISDPQITRLSSESYEDESPPPSPFIRKCEGFSQSLTDFSQRRSQSFDFGLAIPSEPYLEKRRISAPAKPPMIMFKSGISSPIVIHSDWVDTKTPNGDQLHNYHIIRRHSSESPEVPGKEVSLIHHHRRHSSESSRGSFQAEGFIVKALRSRFARTVKQRWHAGYGVDIMQEIPKRQSHEWAESPLQLLEQAKLSVGGGSKRLESPVVVENEDQREAQKFVMTTVDSALKGNGVGFFSRGKLEKYLVDEQLRHLVCTRILEASKGPKGVQVTDVWLDRSIYKGVLALIKACIAGLEHGIYSNCQNGIGSAFLLLEIIYTHFTGKSETQSTKFKSDQEKSRSLPKPEKHQRANLLSSMSLPASSVSISTEYIDIESQTNQSNNNESPASSDGTVQFSETIEMQDMLSIPGRWTLQDQIRQAGSRPRQRQRHYSGRSPKLNHGSPLGGSFDEELSPSRHRERHRSGEFTKSLEPQLRGTSTNTSSTADVDPAQRIRWRSSRKGFPNQAQSEQYMYKELMGKTRSVLWDKADFWMALFLDTVASERSILGLSEKPLQLIDRYKSASEEDCRLMEIEEDNILHAVLHNLSAFMLATAVAKDEIRKRVNRFLGQAHLGLNHTQAIYDLLDNLKFVEGNDVELLTLCSRMYHSKEFMVHVGSNFTAPNAILVVSNRCLQLKSTKDVLIDRYWYEDIIKVNFHPSTECLIMWHRGPDKDSLQHSFCNKNCRELYTYIQKHLQHAALTRPAGLTFEPGDNPVKYPIRDLSTGEGGCLCVTVDGILICFIDREMLIPLHNVHNCSSQRDIFEIEEDDGQVQRRHRFTSTQCSSICEAVLSVFSLVAAQQSQSSSPLRDVSPRRDVPPRQVLPRGHATPVT